jgi:hypothetical protein
VNPPEVTRPALDAWCERWLGSPVDELLFSTGHLSRVLGVRLADGRDVVVKVRPAADRLTGCAQVQRMLWQAGFPCPRPLVGPVAFNGFAANAETLVPDGDVLPSTGVARYAELLARLIRLAPRPSSIAPLTPNPPWVAWDHHHDGIWPPPDDRDADLNTHPETAWLDEIAVRVRARLGRLADTPTVVGHGDWEGQNLRWRDGQPWVVHDWDSVVSGPEPVIVGLAAAVWPCGTERRAATVDESAGFVDAYQHVAGRRWTPDEIGASWAAGLWVYAFNTKKASLVGTPWLSPDEAAQRLRRAGA